MSDLRESLAGLARSLEGLRAALILETSGIEVAAWGEGDFDVLGVEVAEIWRAAVATEALGGSSPPTSVQIAGRDGGGVVLPLGKEYLLALLAGLWLPLGKARFYASQWAYEHREDFP